MKRSLLKDAVAGVLLGAAIVCLMLAGVRVINSGPHRTVTNQGQVGVEAGGSLFPVHVTSWCGYWQHENTRYEIVCEMVLRPPAGEMPIDDLISLQIGNLLDQVDVRWTSLPEAVLLDRSAFERGWVDGNALKFHRRADGDYILRVHYETNQPPSLRNGSLSFFEKGGESVAAQLWAPAYAP